MQALKRAGVPVEELFEEVEGEVAKPVGISKPKTKQEFDALPSGTIYKAPDGTTRRKP